MKQKTINRSLSLIVTVLAVFTAHQLLKYVMADNWLVLHTAPPWTLIACALALLLVLCVFIMYVFPGSTKPLDDETRAMIHKATED